MPTTYTGVEGNVTADRADVTASLPVDGEPRNASSVNTPLQRLADFMQRVRKKAGFLDLASTWTALQTFSAGLAGTTASLSGNATVGGTLGVTGALTAASLNTGSGAITGGALSSSSTGTFSGAVTGASFAFGVTQAEPSYVDSSDFMLDASTSTARIVPGLAYGFAQASTTSSGGQVAVRFRAPRGATIVSVQLLVINLNPVATLSFNSVVVTRHTKSGATVAVTWLNAAGAAGESIAVTSSSGGAPAPFDRIPSFVNVPLIASPGTVPTDGYVRLSVSFPTGANATDLQLLGACLNYTYTALASAT